MTMRVDLERPQRERFFALSLDLLCIAGVDGYFKDLNAAWEDALGWSQAELKSKPFIDFVHPDDRAATIAEATNLSLGIDTVWFENRYRCRDGTYRWLAWRATASPDEELIYAVARDVTAQRASEAALVEERNRLSAILSSMADGAVITDRRGRIVSLNPAMERMAGVTASAVCGRTLVEALVLVDETGQPIPAQERLISKAIARCAPMTSRGYKLSLVAADGRMIPVQVSAAPIMDEQERRLLGGVSIIRDVSYEHEVDELKSSIVSTVSHELGTPLAVIQGYAELLLTRSLDKTRSHEALHVIEGSASRLSRMINDLLSVSKIEAGRITVKAVPLDVARVLDAVAGGFAGVRQIDIQIDDGLPRVVADHDHVVQILTNLVANAIKYSELPVAVRAVRSGEMVDVSVTDHGIGILDADIGRIFDKFVRIDRPEVRSTSGSGLGLFITKRLVDLQDGVIEVRSRNGRGTTFTVGLPIEPARLQPDGHAHARDAGL